jgi:hypothetical protein
MKRNIIVFLIGLIMAASIVTVVSAGDKSIADLESNPTKYENKTIKIKGIVRDADGINIPFIGMRGGCYKIDDGTGSIWVCSDNGVPTRGSEIKVKGTLQNGAVIKGRNYGLVIIEKERKFRKR